jgi:hypothetical protein
LIETSELKHHIQIVITWYKVAFLNLGNSRMQTLAHGFKIVAENLTKRAKIVLFVQV